MPCRKTGKLHGGPAHLEGRVATDDERGLEHSTVGRCYKLWTVLYGSSCDFDDCLITLAEQLGWEDPNTASGLFEALGSAQSHIDQAGHTWLELRQLAIEVFNRCRATESIEVDRYDKRTWDQAIDDALFADGICKACALSVPGTEKQHRNLAGMILHRRTTWEKVFIKLALQPAAEL
jgi:hypothetical protein